MAHRRQFPRLKESQLRSLGTPAALEAGRRVWQSGSVGQTMLSLREPMLLGNVQDETGRLCHVSVRHLAGDEFGPLCDCAVEGFCKHAMALLLAWSHDSHEFTQAVAPSPAEPEESGARQQWLACLRACSMNQLRAMARRHDLPLPTGERESATALLLDVLADPGHASGAVATLNDRERRTLQMVYLLGDQTAGTSSADLQGALGWQNVDDELRTLRDTGLIVGPSASGQPNELFTLAPGVSVSDAGMFDRPGTQAADSFAGNLNALHISEREISLPELLLLARYMQLAPRAMRQEPAQAQGIAALRRWPYLVSELVRLQVSPGWNHQAESTLTVPVPEPWMDDASLVRMRSLTSNDTLNDFVARLAAASGGEGSPAASLPAVYAAWQTLASWTELWPAQQRFGLSVRRSVTASGLTYAGWLQQLSRARRFVTRMLSLLPAGTWFDFPSLLANIHEIRPGFLNGRGSGATEDSGWWLESEDRTGDDRLDDARIEGWQESGDTTVDDTGADAWQATNGAFVAEVLRGPLAWLGAVEVAVEPEADMGAEPLPVTRSTVKAFRLTPPGLALLRGQELPFSRSDQPLHLTDDLSAHVRLGHQDLNAYRLLERIAHFERVQDGEAIYCFNIHAARAAFALGYTGDDVVDELKRMSGAPAPDTVCGQWLAWWESYAQIRWYEGLTLIELADDYILQELLAQTDLREHLLFTFGPRLVAVRPDSADAFSRQLVKKGYTPRID